MTISALFRGSSFALLWLLVLSPGAQAALSPQTGAFAGRCTAEHVKDLFPEPAQPRPELRVLVTSFSGADQNAEVLGRNVGRRMRAVLETHAREEIKSDQTGLYADAIRVKFVPCTLDDHEHARKIGEGAQADVVLWGEAFCTAANPRACQTTTIHINSGNVIQDSPGARIENKSGPVSLHVSEAGTTGRFTTSLTVVRWHGLEANTAGGTQVRRFDQVAAMGLPRLVSGQPQLLLDVVLGLYASRAGRHGLAAEFFERAPKDVAASVVGVANLYQLIGTSYLIAGRKEQGITKLEAARQRCTELRCEATALHALGWAKDRLGDKKAALSSYERALPLWQKVADVSGEAYTLNNIGAVHDALGNKKTALSFFERALPLWRKVGDISGGASTINNIGAVYDALGDKKAALSFYKRALPLWQKVGNVSGEASMLNNIGAVYDALGDKNAALSYLERTLPLWKKVGDVSGEADTLNNIGAVYNALGDKKMALSYLSRALPLWQKVGDVSGEANTLHNIGAVYDALGDKKTALSLYERALPLWQKVDGVSGEANTLHNISAVYDALGDTKKALSLYERALALRQKVGDVSGEARTLNNIGMVYDTVGDKKTALSFYESALALRQKVGDVSGEANTLHNIGAVYDALGDKKTALSYYERALPLLQKMGDVSGEGSTRDKRASVFRDLGRIQEAIQSFREASACYLRRSPPDLDESISSLTLALSLAVKAGKSQEASEVNSRLDTLDPDELRKLLRQARTAGQTKSSSATLLYQRIAARASTLLAKPQAQLLAISQAGLLREQHRSSWPECPGILITEVMPASQAESLGLRAGDIALRYQDSCLFEPDDLITAIGKTKLDQRVTIELWRNGAAQALPAKGGKLGVALESF